MNKIIAIVGPTASGKTAISIQVAKKINGEIISADSRQIYKHIPIATSQPSKKELQEIKHHFIAELNLNEEFNAGEYGKMARKKINEIFSRGKIPIVVGGSGLYIRSLIDGFFEEEINSSEIRKSLYEKLEEKGKEFLYNELKEIDKIAAATMMPHNIRRIIRALEIYYASGKKISDLQKQKVKIDFETVQFAFNMSRGKLYKKINERVDIMIEQGLVKEVQKLKDHGYDYKNLNSLNTVGIKEVFMYLEGFLEYNEMLELIKQNTRRYAKRQLTWFKNDKRINWLDIDNKTDENLADEIINIYYSKLNK